MIKHERNRLIVLSLDAVGSMDLPYMNTLPHFRAFFKRAAGCGRVLSVYPSLTYPAHTSIVTGLYPARHGIVNNHKVQPEKRKPDWLWQRRYIRGTTLYDEARKHGLRVAALTFPGRLAPEGGDRLEASGDLKRYADAFQALDVSQGVPLDTLAGLLQQKKRKLRKTLRKLIHKGWLTAWLDEETDSLYLSAEDYRAARNIPTAPPEEEPAPEAPAEGEEVPLTLETARRFVRVLEEERKIMQDPQAAEELERMHEVTQSICDWLEDHPESLPKIRRFADYYIPTTLKLLHTYNDVQGQRGESAENIRRDIAGILHTLNTAYDNLYDKLLSDVALDVSSEIAALEGMLARDGLTGEGLL